MKKVTEKDCIGDVKGFPVEILQWMCEQQVAQGNEFDPKVFQENNLRDKFRGGFNWDSGTFWHNVIYKKNFNLFFERFPKDVLKVRCEAWGNTVFFKVMERNDILEDMEMFISSNYLTIGTVRYESDIVLRSDNQSGSYRNFETNQQAQDHVNKVMESVDELNRHYREQGTVK